MSKVFVKLVSRPSAQKRQGYITRNGVKSNIDLPKSIGQNKSGGFHFSISTNKTGRLNTGLDKMIENPFMGLPDKLPSEWRNSKIEEKAKISKQEYFEIKMNKPSGYLSSESRPLFDNKTGKGLTYLQRFMKSFYETTVLDLDSVEDELTYYLLLQAHPDKCANSETELTPFSRVFISQVNEDDVKVAKRNDIVEDAIYKLVKLKNEQSESIIRKFAIILEIVKGDVNIEKIKNALSDYIKTQNSKQFEKIEKFNNLTDQLRDAKGMEIFEAKFLLQYGINNRVISDYQGKYIWSAKKGTNLELLGRSYQEALAWLLDIDNRNYREELEAELKAKVDDNRIMAL